MKKLDLFVFIVISLSFNVTDNCGKYRWYVKTLTDTHGAVLLSLPAHISSIHELVNEQRTALNFERDPTLRYADENRVVKVEAILLEIKYENDNDFHIVLKSPNSDETLVGEIPDGDCSTYDGHIALRNHFNSLRQQIVSEIGFNPSKRLKMVNRKVIIEGIPFWDELKSGHHPTGSAPNQREIHPIRKIIFE